MSSRRNIIVRADFAGAANQAAARTSYTGEENDETWSVPLESVGAPGVVAAYVCSWDFPATGHDPTVLWGELATAGAEEADLADVGSLLDLPTDLSTRRLVIFDPDVLDHQLVVDQLGLRPPIVAD